MKEKEIFIIHPYLKTNRLLKDSDLVEAQKLIEAIDLKSRYIQSIGLEKINPKTFINTGSVCKLKLKIKEKKVDLIFFNCSLAPLQQRNLEKEIDCKIIDRTGLILEIFGARANSNEGKLQVTLASLQYQKSRLVRSWTHLERQRGGAGFMGGPGESQIESDRRQITEQINRLKKKIKVIDKTRNLQRYRRKKNNIPIISLVGYTNSGKSTLFNYLTKENMLAKDMLFASLDSTIRKVKINDKYVLIIDTVGFIKSLPTMLIAAFKSTLDEIINSDIILHVRDISNQENSNQKLEVIKILNEIGIEKHDQRIIDVINKIDLVDYKNNFNRKNSMSISAISGFGIRQLKKRIFSKLSQDRDTLFQQPN